MPLPRAAMKRPLEAFKFVVYLAVPIASVYLFSRPYVADFAIRNRAYVSYPPEADIAKLESFKSNLCEKRLAEEEAALKRPANVTPKP